MDTRSEALLILQKNHFTNEYMTIVNRRPMSVCPVVTIKSN